MATARLKSVEEVVAAALPSTAYVVTSSGTGSGFCVEPHLFVTNYHVISDAAQGSVKVRCNGRVFDARILGTAEEVDLALLFCDSPAPTLPLQTNVVLGESCVAIGSPGGLINSVTRGIVSGLARAAYGPDGRLFEHVLQTDAVINPGNSGGPLLNLSGEVIGMPFLGGAMQGINYAVSAEMIRFVVPQLRKQTALRRARIGVTLLEEYTETGEQVVKIVRTADDDGGLLKGDVVLKFNGADVERRIDIWYELCAMAGKSSAKAEVMRNGERLSVSVRLAPPNSI